MCGLFGVYAGSTLSKMEIDAFVELGFVSGTRGLDSTGVLKCHRKGHNKFSITSEKDVGNPMSFLSRYTTQSFMRDKSPLMLMGHARWATIGDVNRGNAQPIHEGNILGCHNGTIDYYSPKNKEDLKHTTDSRNLFKTINKEGIVKALSKTSVGAYALTFVDTHQRTLNFIRNSERELWLVKSKAQSLFWASERRILEFMMEELGGKDRYDLPHLISKNSLHSVILGDGIGDIKIQYLDSDITKEYNKTFYPSASKPWEKNGTSVPLLTSQAPPISGLFCTACCWNFNQCKCAKGVKKSYIRPDPKLISANLMYYTPENAKTVVPHDVEKYIGYERRNLALSVAKALLDEGCSGCNNKFGIENKVYWFSEKEYVCRDCKETNEVIQADLKKVKIYGSGVYVERVN